MRKQRRFQPFDPVEGRRAIDDILNTPTPMQAQTRIQAGPVEAKTPVPVKLTSSYYWQPWSLFSGLTDSALPVVTLPCWKILSAVALRQLNHGLPQQNASQPVAISMSDFCMATGMSRMTVARGIQESIASGWLMQEKRRTLHGGNAVALYSINWKKAESAERSRRKREQGH